MAALSPLEPERLALSHGGKHAGLPISLVVDAGRELRKGSIWRSAGQPEVANGSNWQSSSVQWAIQPGLRPPAVVPVVAAGGDPVLSMRSLSSSATTGRRPECPIIELANRRPALASILAAGPARSDQCGPQGVSVFEVPLGNPVSSLRRRCSPIFSESGMALLGTVADVVIAPIVVLRNGVHDT